MLPRATEWRFPCYTKFPSREIAAGVRTRLNLVAIRHFSLPRQLERYTLDQYLL